jgi:excisionase family DNA binding protein
MVRTTSTSNGIMVVPFRRTGVTTHSNQTAGMAPKFLSVRDFAAIYNVGVTKAYQMMGAGELPSIKIGKLTRIRIEDADSWANGLPARVASPLA